MRKTIHHLRGEQYGSGRFVGVRNGVVWVCYGDDAEFQAMCQAFDA